MKIPFLLFNSTLLWRRGGGHCVIFFIDYHTHLDNSAIISKCYHRKAPVITFRDQQEQQAISPDLWLQSRFNKEKLLLREEQTETSTGLPPPS